MKQRLTLYLTALCVVTLWGASFPLTKAALTHLGPIAIAFMRWLISTLVLAGWLAWRGREPSSPVSWRAGGALLRQEWRTILWVALTGISLYYLLQNLALRYTTATNAGVLSNLTPVFMVLIAAPLLHERLHLPEWAALLAAFAGAVLVSQGAGHLTLGGPGLLGDGLMIVAGLFAAIYSLGGKGLSERHPPAVVITVVAGIGALLLLPFALVEGLRFDLPLTAWGILILLGLGSGALANLWWLALLARVRASRAALALFLIPVVSAALSVTLLKEPLTWMLVVGGALVLGGMLLVQRSGHAAA